MTGRRTHGLSRTRLYRCWADMKTRCRRKYSGIKVCDDWLDASMFFEWALSNGYSEGKTLDRVDNAKGYGPSNCRWADMSQQNLNRNNSRNTSGYKGVTVKGNRWRAGIKINGKNKFLGSFTDPLEAAKAFDKAAKEAHGKDARLNFV